TSIRKHVGLVIDWPLDKAEVVKVQDDAFDLPLVCEIRRVNANQVTTTAGLRRDLCQPDLSVVASLNHDPPCWYCLSTARKQHPFARAVLVGADWRILPRPHPTALGLDVRRTNKLRSTGITHGQHVTSVSASA